MRILHVINNLGSGGAEKLIEDLLPLLNQDKDIEAELLLLTDDNNVFYNSIIAEGIKVNVIKYKNIYDPRNIIEIKKHIENGQYDIIHSHLFPTQYWVAIAKLILNNKRIRFITTEHSTHNRRREKKIFRYMDRFIYKQYDTIISITDKTKTNLIEWIDPERKNSDKHIVIENGINIKKFKEALPYKKPELIEGISEGTKLICMVGRFSEAKDQSTLIKAMSFLSEDVHLVLVGEGPLIGKNKELAAKLRVSERVHFLGFRQDIPKILKTVDIVVLSSHWEGFGLSAVEGMSAGKPVLASDVSGLREVIYGAGLIFPQGNDEELANIGRVLLGDKIEYQKIKEACEKRAKNYDIEKLTKKHIYIYGYLAKIESVVSHD